MMLHHSKLFLVLSTYAVVSAGKHGDLTNPDDQHIELFEDERIEGTWKREAIVMNLSNHEALETH
jgi:hypothetical protein